MSLKPTVLAVAVFFATITLLRGQQAASSITQARLFGDRLAPVSPAFDENGNALPNERSTSGDDDSFGTQVILKNQEQPRTINVFGNVSASFTNNVDLTPHQTRSDFFVATDFGIAWRPILSRGLVGDVSASGSVFRYDRANDLDFERMTTGAGLTWAVPRSLGIVAFGRYDFIELLDSHSNQLLQDHEFTIGAQKIFVLARTHFFTAGITGVAGISTPRSQQRDQAGVYGAYHLQITRSFDVDLVYRYAAQFYNEDRRIDHNQTVSLVTGFYPTRWLRIDGSISAARNDSNRSAFEYDVFNVGSGVRFSVFF